MKPYYGHGGIQIFCGDCREVMPTLTADLVVTDPPYGIADASNVSRRTVPRTGVGRRTGSWTEHVNTWHPISEWDVDLDPTWLPIALRFGLVALFGHWRKRRAFEDVCGMEARAEIIWAKDMHCGPPCPAAMQDERIWIFAKNGLTPTRFETTVWNVAVIPTWAHKHHKNEKPEGLMRRLISWLPAGAIVDPFMGSGTTLVAAKRLGRKAIGIEIEEKYCEIAAKRLQQGVLPLEVGA